MNRKQRRQVARSAKESRLGYSYANSVKSPETYSFILDPRSYEKALARAIIGPWLGWGLGVTRTSYDFFNDMWMRLKHAEKTEPASVKLIGFDVSNDDTYDETESGYAISFIKHCASKYGWEFTEKSVDDDTTEVSLNLDDESLAAIQLTQLLTGNFEPVYSTDDDATKGFGRYLIATVMEHGRWLKSKPITERFPDNRKYAGYGVVIDPPLFMINPITFNPYRVAKMPKTQLAAR